MTKDQQGDISREQLREVLDIWLKNGLKNVRFSGGEPTIVYNTLKEAITICKQGGVENIAISTNGSAPLDKYIELIGLGVNDFSISLDACCSQLGNKMSGTNGTWETVVSNIRELSKLTYVTVGMVFTEENINRAVESVLFATDLGVSDIRVIPSAQYNKALTELAKKLNPDILSKYKILSYRINNIKNDIPVRGLSNQDSHKCWLALDDMAVVKNKHYPCIIYLREKGQPIGEVDSNVRKQRLNWIIQHNPKEDPICKNMCLDVCVDYNKKAEEYKYEHE